MLRAAAQAARREGAAVSESIERFELHIDFPGASNAEAARYARDLEAALQRVDAAITVTRAQSDADAQDAGSILAVILGSASLVALFREIGVHIAKRGDAIRVSLPEGTVIAQGKAAENVDATELVAVLKGRPRPRPTAPK